MKTSTLMAVLGVILLDAFAFPLVAVADTFGSGPDSFEIQFVTIGDINNTADIDGMPNPVGSVPYAYRIGQFEISRDVVTKANALGGLGITLDSMGFVAGGPRPEMSATGISWNEAGRLVNWLNESQGYPAAYRYSTQPGDEDYGSNQNVLLWQSDDPGYNAANPIRNDLAHYFLPNVDEWYKAAYYDPSSGDYSLYPTGGNVRPTAVANGTATQTAVYRQSYEQGPADVTQAGAVSPYGTMAQGGNVWELEETEFDLVNDDGSSLRSARGGSWFGSTIYHAELLSAKYRNYAVYPTGESAYVGFRVASIYEPLLGDFNLDGQLDALDINDLTERAAGATHPTEYDLTNDGLVNSDDIAYWAHDIFGTWLGDADLNHEFNSNDLILVAAASTYEQVIPAVWTTGDFNGDGFFNSDDLIDASADQGYEAGLHSTASVAAVPEPAAWNLMLISLFMLSPRRRKLC